MMRGKANAVDPICHSFHHVTAGHGCAKTAWTETPKIDVPFIVIDDAEQRSEDGQKN